jgi:ribosomal protein L7/L12
MDQAYLKRLAQLEARMSRMEATMQALVRRLDINPAEIMPPEPPETKGIHDNIRAALMMGNKIEAIKLYREYYGVGLKEAHDAINAM